MLDAICPIQFIEGINEGGEFEKEFEEACISARNYSSLSIQYNPKLSYSLAKLEILLAYGEMPPESKISVTVRSNYDDKPSDMVLSHGTIVPKKRHSLVWDWEEIELQPVVLLRNNKYWVTIDTAHGFFGIVTAKVGDEPVVKVRIDTKWTPYGDSPKSRIMLKFFGRVLPTSS